MDVKELKTPLKMGKRMDYGHFGILMDRKKGKEITRMGKKKDYGHIGM